METIGHFASADGTEPTNDGTLDTPNPASIASATHTNATNPSAPSRQMCHNDTNVNFLHQGIGTRYPNTSNVSLGFHCGRRPPGPQPRQAPAPFGLARWCRRHPICRYITQCGTFYR